MSLEIINKKKNNDHWKVSLKGEMDINTYNSVKNELNDMIKKETLDLKIDCSELSYIDSTGIGVLIGILKKIKKEDKMLYIINAEKNIKRLFNITGLDKIFVIK
ncbi:MAG: STAS domain-containing protein [Bacillota bacterium]